MLLLPAPLGPTMAVLLPEGMLNETPSNTARLDSFMAVISPVAKDSTPEAPNCSATNFSASVLWADSG